MPLLARTARVEERWEGAATRRVWIDARLLAMLAVLVAVFAGFYVLGRASGKRTAPVVEQPRAAVIGAGATIPLALSSAPPLDTGVVEAPKPRPSAPATPAAPAAPAAASPPAAVETSAPVTPAPPPVTPAPAATPAPVQAAPTPAPARPAPSAPSGGGSSSSGGEGGGSFNSSG